MSKSAKAMEDRFTDREILELPCVINTIEAGRVLGCARTTVTRLLRDGELKGFRVGTDWRLSRDAVLAAAGLSYEDLMESVARRDAAMGALAPAPEPEPEEPQADKAADFLAAISDYLRGGGQLPDLRPSASAGTPAGGGLA